MSDRSTRPVARVLTKLLAERRVYIRSVHGTRYVTFSPLSQLGIVGLAAALIGWTGFATTIFIEQATDARRAEVQVETLREAYEARLSAHATEQVSLEGELAKAMTRGDAVTARLTEKQMRLVDTANALRKSDAELAVLRETYSNLLVRQRAEAQRLATLEREMAGLQVALAQSLAERDGVTEALDLFTSQMADVIAERDEASAAETALSDTVSALEDELTRWETRQSRFLSQVEAAARLSMVSLSKVFERANIDLDRILVQTKRDFSGKGGIFEPLEDESAAAAPDPRVAALMTDLERVNLMRLATDRLPFGRPVRGARLTSGFGPRRDPFRGHTAMHSGIDWAAPRGTPIYATANGVVSFVGRMSGYGIVVKIKHAFGYETLYAHLSRARVDVGQHVERGDRIADMGNTGRSTGPHLHYEIRVNKEPVNPAKFIEAARDVL